MTWWDRLLDRLYLQRDQYFPFRVLGAVVAIGLVCLVVGSTALTIYLVLKLIAGCGR